MNDALNSFIKAAAIRAVRTGAQTALSLITVGIGFFDIDWFTVISVCLTSMLVSILTSIVTGLPETKIDGFIDVTEQDIGIEGAKPGDIIRFKITDGGSK